MKAIVYTKYGDLGRRSHYGENLTNCEREHDRK